MQPQALLETGYAALKTAQWQAARRAFEQAIEAEPSPEAHDGLGLVFWWLNDIRASHHHRTLAYQQFKKRGDARRAARIAMWLAREQVFLDGNTGAMQGWFARAERLLPQGPRGVEHAWFDLSRGSLLAPPAELEMIARQTLETAQQGGDENLEAYALAFSGIVRVVQGRVTQGMADLDEAMVAATSGGLNFIYVSEIFCLLLSACDLAGDLGRMEQWCRTAAEYAERNKFPFLAATCRVTYGSLLTATGQWDIAETELEQAIRSFEQGHYALRKSAVIKLAELRVLQTRFEQAEALLAGFEDQSVAAIPLARLALARGDNASARSILEQALSQTNPHSLEAAPLLRLLVEVHLNANHLKAARDTAVRFSALAVASESDLLLAQADLAEGQILRASGSAESAKYFQAALQRLVRYDQSVLAARARFEMAQLSSDTDRAAAVTWARAAYASFERMGAKQDAGQVAHFLRGLGVNTASRARSTSTLTAREQEVLTFLGQGLTNREIAERLVVSPKTVEHHVSQILSKLGAKTRAEAAAIAVRG